MEAYSSYWHLLTLQSIFYLLFSVPATHVSQMVNGLNHSQRTHLFTPNHNNTQTLSGKGRGISRWKTHRRKETEAHLNCKCQSHQWWLYAMLPVPQSLIRYICLKIMVLEINYEHLINSLIYASTEFIKDTWDSFGNFSWQPLIKPFCKWEVALGSSEVYPTPRWILWKEEQGKANYVGVLHQYISMQSCHQLFMSSRPAKQLC